MSLVKLAAKFEATPERQKALSEAGQLRGVIHSAAAKHHLKKQFHHTDMLKKLHKEHESLSETNPRRIQIKEEYAHHLTQAHKAREAYRKHTGFHPSNLKKIQKNTTSNILFNKHKARLSKRYIKPLMKHPSMGRFVKSGIIGGSILGAAMLARKHSEM
jgi:hypothetical protein